MVNDDLKTSIMEIVARGWHYPSNEHKTLDSDLVIAITEEVVKSLKVTGISNLLLFQNFKEVDMAYCYKPKKNVTGMKQFLVKLANGKKVSATISYKEKLETTKEIDKMIAGCNDRLELNEATLAANKITAISYENTRKVEMRERERLETRRNVIKDLVYVGQSVEFLRYLSPAT